LIISIIEPKKQH